MKKTTISVLMPVYNISEQFLRESIESILNQTFTDFEFIIVDDGSTDNSAKIIKEYAKHDKRIHYIRKENSGITKTLLHGLKFARGEFIARMDSDDIAMPERFATQVEFLKTHPEITVVGGFLETMPHTSIVKYPLRPTILDMYRGCCVGHPAVMWRRADFEKYDLHYDPQYPFAQDYELWSRAVRFVKFANIPMVLLKYRFDTHNVSHTHQKQQSEIAEHVRESILEFLSTDTDVQCKIKRILSQPINDTRPLPSFIGRLICCFIPLRQYRHNFRNKYVRSRRVL